MPLIRLLKLLKKGRSVIVLLGSSSPLIAGLIIGIEVLALKVTFCFKDDGDLNLAFFFPLPLLIGTKLNDIVTSNRGKRIGMLVREYEKGRRN